LVGADGPTHAGAYDIAYLSNLPGFTVMAAADEAELVHMVATAAAHDGGPIALRYPRGEGTGVALPETGIPIEIGKGRIVRKGSTVALLSLGTRLGECLAAAALLEDHGISVTVADARFVKPLDTALVEHLSRSHDCLLTVEEGAFGGFGAMVLHHLNAAGLLGKSHRVRNLFLPDHFIQQADPARMYDEAGLNTEQISRAVLDSLEIRTAQGPAQGMSRIRMNSLA
ncbi:MAG: 1-deoxy-D-xylulose-5-phosphate synthase, partial [Nitratireductor sp.]|nr:1-deoxy-D-xylulose-5-phosphate synthase [Nitratireductor sp.]